MNSVVKSICLLLALFMGLSTSGCASGGYKLTRQYARFVNSQNILIRIILYIFTAIVFVATLIVDSVVFNTIDFWNGTVSQGTFEFSEGDKKFVVEHSIDAQNLKRSVIVAQDLLGKKLQEVVLQETADAQIQVWIDGQLSAKIENIKSFPIAKHFNKKGQFSREESVLLGGMTAQK